MQLISIDLYHKNSIPLKSTVNFALHYVEIFAQLFGGNSLAKT